MAVMISATTPVVNRTLALLSVVALAISMPAAVQGYGGGSQSTSMERRLVTKPFIFPRFSPCTLLLSTKGRHGCYGQHVYGAPVELLEADANVAEWVNKTLFEGNGKRVAIMNDAQVASLGELLFTGTEEGLGEPWGRFAAKRALAAVLVLQGPSDERGGFSPADKCGGNGVYPLCLGYNTSDFNPVGNALLQRDIPFHIFLLEEEQDIDIGDYVRSGRVVADVRGDMQASKAKDSFECLEQNTCLPLGGNSVVSQASRGPGAKGWLDILITSQLSSLGMFREGEDQGAADPLSGLVGMLATALTLADAVSYLQSKNLALSPMKSLGFAAFAGEAYGNMGSRRLLYEIDRNGSSVADFGWTGPPPFIMDIGGIGPPPFSTSAYTNASFTTTKYGGTYTPRIEHFNEEYLFANAGIAGERYERSESVRNLYYASRYDNGPRLMKSLLTKDMPTYVSAVNAIFDFALHETYNVTAAELTDLGFPVESTNHDNIVKLCECFFSEEGGPRGGMNCNLASELLGKDWGRGRWRSTYVGVIQENPDEISQNGRRKQPLAQLVHAILSKASATISGNEESITRYVPAVQPYLSLNTTGGDWRLKNMRLSEIPPLFNEIDEIWHMQIEFEPLYTESNWPNAAFYLRLYQPESSVVAWREFVVGSVVMILAMGASTLVSNSIKKAARHLD